MEENGAGGRPYGRHFAAPHASARLGDSARWGDSARPGDPPLPGDSARWGDSARLGDSARPGDPARPGASLRPQAPARRRTLLAPLAVALAAAVAVVLWALAAAPDPAAWPARATQAQSLPASQAAPALGEPVYATVTFSAVGDNLMNYPVVESADANVGEVGDGLYDFTPMYAGVQDIVAARDLNFIDIETILGGDYLGISGYPVFNSPSAIAGQVAAFGWNMATTATNHSLDMGLEGIANSSATWAQYPQVAVTGTFTSWEDRVRVRVLERGGIRFALLAYTDYLNGIPVPEGAGYAVALADPAAMAEDVARAREQADVVIVAMSWGSENDFTPNETQRFYAQTLTDLGVDLVVGFGPHVIQPIEWYEGLDASGSPTGTRTLVVFSLGNFLSNQPEPYEEVEGCFTCSFERLGETGPVTLTGLGWTPLVNHIDGGWHQVFKLKDYTAELAWSHDILSSQADPLGYCYQLTQDVVVPSALAAGVAIDW